MKIIQIVLLLAFFTSCNLKKTPEEKVKLEIEALNKKELELNAQTNQGKLIATIEFGLKANKEDLEVFEDGIVPWISIEKPEDQIDRLIDADKVVIEYPEVILVIDYPLNKPAEFIIKSSEKGGFTKKQLALVISKKYHEIYDAEESSAKTKTIPLEKREGLINRNETDGKYGIWGHDISDLDLSSVEVYKTEDGKIQILLGIES
jgi:hypothetical protein